MDHPTDRITYTTAFVTPVVEHWLEREVVQLIILFVFVMTSSKQCIKRQSVHYSIASGLQDFGKFGSLITRFNLSMATLEKTNSLSLINILAVTN